MCYKEGKKKGQDGEAGGERWGKLSEWLHVFAELCKISDVMALALKLYLI